HKRQQRAAGKTFAEVFEEWINHFSWKWRSTRHVRILRKHCDPLADVAINKIDKAMIIDTFISFYRKRPAQALRALRVLKQVLDYAITRDYRPEPNPARWRDNLENVFPERPKTNGNHYPSLPFQDVPELMNRLQVRGTNGATASALEFQILCASRPGEVRGMKWSEVNEKTRVWTLPPERTKQNRQHRVPLSNRCMEILAHQKEYTKSDYVFPGQDGPLDPKSMAKLLERMDLPLRATHGFRQSFRNWTARARISTEHGTAERIDRDLAEMCLGHQIKGEIEACYWTDDGLEERRQIMEAWALFLTESR